MAELLQVDSLERVALDLALIINNHRADKSGTGEPYWLNLYARCVDVVRVQRPPAAASAGNCTF